MAIIILILATIIIWIIIENVGTLWTLAFKHMLLLTLWWLRPLSHRNQSIDLLCKWMNWFLYDRDLRFSKQLNIEIQLWSLLFAFHFNLRNEKVNLLKQISYESTYHLPLLCLPICSKSQLLIICIQCFCFHLMISFLFSIDSTISLN